MALLIAWMACEDYTAVNSIPSIKPSMVLHTFKLVYCSGLGSLEPLPTVVSV
ncbi:hypothetical protein DSUL_260045 [Desulfovibrionales bacterium]